MALMDSRRILKKIIEPLSIRKKSGLSFWWALYVVVSLGLATGVGIGIADNGDGARVFSPAGLNPVSDEQGLAKGQGYVVTDFVAASSRDPVKVINRIANMHYPTLNSYILTSLGVLSPDRTVSLFTLGWIYLLIGLTIIWLVPLGKGLVPTAIVFGVLALGPYARWTVSTYADTPAFFGMAAVLIALVIALRPVSSGEFFRLNSLVWFGGLLLALSKVAYAVATPFILLIWIAVVLVFQRHHLSLFLRVPLMLTSILGIGLTVLSLHLQFSSSDRDQAGKTNSHHFVMDIALPNFPPEVVNGVIPENIRELAPERYWPRAHEWKQVDGWEETFGNQREMNRLRFYTLSQPGTLYQAISATVEASTQPDIPYTPPNTWSSSETPSLALLPLALYSLTVGFVETLLAPLSVPTWNLVVFAITAPMAIFATLLVRRWNKSGRLPLLAVQLALMIWLSGFFGGVFAGAAVLGDGYQELAKHAILSSYMFAVYLVSFVALVGVTALTWWTSRELTDS